MGDKFYAVVNDLIGGYDVSMWDKPVSEHDYRSEVGEFTIGTFLDESWAKKVADALNVTSDGPVEIDIVLEPAPDPPNYHFVETENAVTHEGMRIGEWMRRDDGLSAIRFKVYLVRDED